MIDALAASRSTDMDSNFGSHDGVFISEMDSVQVLLCVTMVVPANRPDVIVRHLSVSSKLGS